MFPNMTSNSSLIANDTLTNESESCYSMNDQLHDEWSTYLPVQIVFAILYASIIVFAGIGNGCVIVAIFSDSRLRAQVQNVLIVSLSLSDCVVLLISGIITPTSAFTKQWYFGGVLCRLVPLLQGITIFISTLTLTVIAIDRYMLVVMHSRQSITLQQTYVIIATIIVAAAGISTPPVVYSVYETVSGYCGIYCYERWPGANEHLRTVYGSCILILQFLLPTSVIAFCYISIFCTMSKGMLAGQKPKRNGKGVSSASNTGVSEHRMAERHRRQRRTTMMLIGMVVAFGCSWFPQVLYMLLRDLGQLPTFVTKQVYFTGICTHCLSMTSTLCNPVLYAWLNEQLRTAFLNVLPSRVRDYILSTVPAARVQGGHSNSRVQGDQATNVNTNHNYSNAQTMVNNTQKTSAETSCKTLITQHIPSNSDSGLQLTLLYDSQQVQLL